MIFGKEEEVIFEKRYDNNVLSLILEDEEVDSINLAFTRLLTRASHKYHIYIDTEGDTERLRVHDSSIYSPSYGEDVTRFGKRLKDFIGELLVSRHNAKIPEEIKDRLRKYLVDQGAGC